VKNIKLKSLITEESLSNFEIQDIILKKAKSVSVDKILAGIASTMTAPDFNRMMIKALNKLNITVINNKADKILRA